MIADRHEPFRHMIDENLAGAISREKEEFLREHLATCAPCTAYLSASNRVIAGLSGFSFEVNPTLHAKVLAALRLEAEKPAHGRFKRLREIPLTSWSAFVAALTMSFAGSAIVYQIAKRLAIPMHCDPAQIQASVLMFWLLPSLCAALCLLAAPGEKRGIA